MAKFANDMIMDEGLNWLKANANRVSIGTASPSTYAEAMTTYAVGTLACATGNFTIGNGDSSGRKVTYGPGTVTVGTTGTVTHVAWCGTAGSGTLMAVGTCAPTAVTAGGTAVIGAIDITEIADIT